MNAEEGSLDTKQEPRPLDVSGWRSAGEYLLIPDELQYVLRMGAVLKTNQGYLVVTGNGLRCVHKVAEDVRNGVVLYSCRKNPNPVLLQAANDFSRKLSQARGEKPAFNRTGTRHK